MPLPAARSRRLQSRASAASRRPEARRPGSRPGVRALGVVALLVALACPARAETLVPAIAYPVAVPGATDTYASGIDGSRIVGSYYGAVGQGFYYDGSTYTTLAAPAATDETSASAISGDTIVGYYAAGSNAFGFAYSISTQNWTTIAYPGARGTHVNGIDGGNMVGFSVVGGSGPGGTWNGFLYDGSTFTPLPGPLGADKTFANAIHGTLIGGQYNTAAAPTTWLGFLYDTSTSLYSPFVLPFAGVTSTFVYGISDDWITGSYSDAGGDHAFIYARNGGTAWSIDAPGAVNGTGGGGVSGNNFVVGGADASYAGFSYVYTMSAVPEIDPAGLGSVLALVIGSFGLLERRRLAAA